MPKQYVFYNENDNGPHNVRVFDTLAAVENFLREFSEEYFGEGIDDDGMIIELFAEENEYIRIYEITPDDSRELTPFAEAPASAA